MACLDSHFQKVALSAVMRLNTGSGCGKGTGVRCGEDIWAYKDAAFLRKLKLSSKGKAGIMWLFLYSRAAAEKKPCVWLPKLSLKQLEFTAELRDR